MKLHRKVNFTRLEYLGNLTVLYFYFLDNKHNFEKYSHSMIDSLGSPYDYGSIMHYGSREFAKWPWLTSIRPKQKGVSIGQRSHLSVQDAIQIKRFYGCK